MKKTLLSAFVLFPYWAAFAQTSDPKADTTKPIPTIQSAADDRAKKLLPQFAPLSPNAASMQKFGDYQVNLATGIPSIEIPIFTVQSGGLKLPITLRYHASGIRMSDHASWVGLGWTLDYGVSLTRTVQGLPDQGSSIVGGYLIGSNYITASKDFCNSTTDFDYGNFFNSGIIDTQPDIFSYSTLSRSGRFLLGQTTPSGQILESFLIPYEPIIVPRPTFDGSGNITKAEIIEADGTQYIFGTNGNKEGTYVSDDKGFKSYDSGFLCSEINSPSSNDKITFTYQEGGSQGIIDRQFSGAMIHASTNNSIYQNSTSITASENVILSTFSQKNLHKINFENGEIEFVQATGRTDLTNSFTLQSIIIKSIIDGVMTPIRVVDFSYNSFKDANGDDAKLRLTAVSFKDPSNTNIETYTPEYFTNAFSWRLGTIDYSKKDFFGFYNGQNNLHLLTVGSYLGIPVVNGAANRLTSNLYMMEGVLKKLTYPTGGFTEFDFETNKYKYLGTEYLAGGLRVKTIKSYNNNSSLAFMKRYEYSSEDGAGIGIISYGNWKPESRIETTALRFYNTMPNEIITASQASIAQKDFGEGSFDGSPVYYTGVKEYFEDATTSLNGLNAYTFSYFPDFITDNYLEPQRNIQPWKRGLLLTKKTYNATNDLLAEETQSYQEFKTSNLLAAATIGSGTLYQGAVPRFTTSCSTGFIRDGDLFGTAEMVYSPISYYSNTMRPINETSTIDNVNKSTATTYNSKMFIASTQSADSKTGDNYTESFTYPFDASYGSDPTAQQMVVRNQLNTVLENELKETISGTTSTIYKLRNVFNSFTGNNARGLSNNILPAETWVAPTGGTLEKRVEYKNYDNDGNLLHYTVDGQLTTLLYGYNNNQVTGIIKNATLSDVNTALASSGLSTSAFSVNVLSAGQESILQNFQHALPNTLVDFYTHYPHIGISQQFAPNGLKTSYTYDGFQRLILGTDHEGNILQSNSYKISPTENYIYSLKPRIATSNIITASSHLNSVIDYQYFDGLGRPTQALGFGQSPSQKSIIKSELSYDSFNRQIKALLPVESAGLITQPIANARALAQSFYGDAIPVDSVIFEPSPLNRTSQSFGVGQAWHTANKKTEEFYEAGGTEVRNYEIASNKDILLKGTYPPNSLYKKRILDEQGNETISYTDLRGRVIEKRQELSKGNYAHTHYIYDGLGRTQAIIQPEGYELNIGFSYNGQGFQNWVFFYEYDQRGRNILKHVPAGGLTKMVFDKKDRLVMEQNDLQASLDRWNFMKYDAFDREVFKGETVNSTAFSSIQTAFDTHPTPDETWGSGGYNGVSFPSIANSSGNDVQHYSFYDQYDFVSALVPNFIFNSTSALHSLYPNAKGKMTGEVKYNSADHNKYYTSVNYFDNKNRLIQNYATKIKSSSNSTEPTIANFQYNFAGEEIYKLEVANFPSPLINQTNQTQTIRDHVGRPTLIRHGINSNYLTDIVSYSYDGIGRLTQKIILPNGNFLSGGIQDYINSPPSPTTGSLDEARKAIILMPGTNILANYLGLIIPNAPGGQTISGLQRMDYSWHIRGGLKGINLDTNGNPVPNVAEGDLFANLYEYESQNKFNGNVGKQTWSRVNSTQTIETRSFNYDFDSFDRLKEVSFFGIGNENYATPNISYDKNGNIKAFTRNGLTANSNTFGAIDNLTYYYSGNRLRNISDAVSNNINTKDFRDNSTGIDYTYWANGALKTDGNKGINNIEINTFLNKNQKVEYADGRWVNFIYDGSGELIQRTNSAGDIWEYSSN